MMEAARAFFVAYVGAAPKPTSYRRRAERRRWHGTLAAFLDAEEYARTIAEMRENCAQKAAAGDPLAGAAASDLERVEGVEGRARELRELYEQTLKTGVLPEHWRAYSARPGARVAARHFEQYLCERRRAPCVQESLL
jgi:hypothetical protein